MPSSHFLNQICTIYLFLKLVHAIEVIIGHVREAEEHEFPFIVGLSENIIKPQHIFCSGTLITAKHVLTSKHCLIDRVIVDVQILLGSVDLRKCTAYEPEVWITYQEWKYHNLYSFPPHVHDVAIVMLKRYVEHANVHPAIIATFQRHDVYGSEVKLVGWGLTNGNVTSDVLRTGKSKVLTRMESESQIHQLTKIDCPVDIWELLTKSDPWTLIDCGDSGGPLINNQNEVIGINTGTCPGVSLILKIHLNQCVNLLLEKRLNVHVGLHHHDYVEFIEYFTHKHVNFH